MIDTTDGSTVPTAGRPLDAPIDAPLDFGTASRLAQALEVHWTDDEASTSEASFPRIGDYLLDRHLGQGGGGSVYHAVLPGWNDDFAIKYLHAPIGEGRAAARARRELDIVEQLDIPSTPRVFEYGVHEGRLFIVSEHVDGEALDVFCSGRGLDRRARVALLVKVADAVHALHGRGVIHRDLKPSNILVRADGSPVVIDLGIATLLTDDPAESITAVGAPVGSVAYMAPEQARADGSAASIQCDIYGLGATACSLLAGRTPHDVEGLNVVDAIRKVESEPVRDPRRLDPTLPKPLAAILQRLVALRPEDRFASMVEFADDLRRWLDGEPVRSQPPSWWRNRWLSIRRRPGRWAWGGVTGLLAFAAVGFGVASGVSAAEAAAWETYSSKYEDVIDRASRDFTGVVGSDSFGQALGMLTFLESHLDAGAGEFEIGPELGAETVRTRGEFTTRILEAIHASGSEEPVARDLAMAAVRSVYEDAGRWSPELEAHLDLLLAAHERD